MRAIAGVVVARGQDPARLAIPLVAAGIGDAMRAIDLHVALIQIPVVGIAIFQATRIEPAERVVRNKRRAAIRLAKQIGRASCRERGCQYVSISVVAVSLNKTTEDEQIQNNRTLNIQ